MADSNFYGKNDEMKLEGGMLEAIEGKLDLLRFIRLFKRDD